MKQVERRLRALETAANVTPCKPWQRVIVEVGESEEDALARAGIGPDDNVIITTIYPGRPLVDISKLEVGLSHGTA